MTDSKLKGRRYIILARSSSNKQEASVPDQIRLAREFGDRHGAILVDTLKLEGLKATNPRNMERVIDEVIARKLRGEAIEDIYVHDASRLSRSGGPEAAVLLAKLQRAVIGVVYYMNHIENRRHERVIRHLEFEMAHEQVWRGSQTIARGLTSALEARRRLYCSRRPFGTALGIRDGADDLKFVIRDRPDGTQVKVDPPTGAILETFAPSQHFHKQKFEQPVLLPGDPEAIETVGLIYRFFLQDDLGTSRIAKALNELGRPGPSGPWNAPTIQRILDNPIYTGREVAQRESRARYHRTGLDANGQPFEVELKPDDCDEDSGDVYTVIRPAAEWSVQVNDRMRDFLPEDVRDAARHRHDAIMERQRSGRKPQPRRDAARDSDYLLAGLLRTAAGHYPMTGTQGGPDGGYRYYRVDRRRVKLEPGIEVPGRVRADLVEAAVIERIHQALLADPSLRDTVFELLRSQYEATQHRQDRRMELEAERADLLDSLAFAKVQAKTSPRAAALLLADLEPRIAAVEEALEAIAEVPVLSENYIRREAEQIVSFLASQASILRDIEPGRAKQMLQSVLADLTIEPTTCELKMALALPQEAVERLGALRGLVYRTLKRTHSGVVIIGRRTIPLPDGTCCRRKPRRKAA